MDRPAIFVANVNAEGQCTTVENEEVNFPRPGPDTEGSLSEPGFWCAGPPTFAGSGGDPPQAIALSNTPTASTALTRVTYSRTPIETGAISGVVADPAFGVNIINNLDSSIHAWSVARKPGAERVIDARGGAYFEAWRAREDEGGISIKMALEASQESVLQFEYSLQSSIVYWDVSFIDMDRESNFIMGGITVTTSDPTCRGLTCLPQDKNRNQVYLEPDDNYAIRGCPMQTNVTLSIGSRPGKRAWA
ncbi:hypothetical protein BJY00DRAFT_287870 [Aspergillus carlsbadensis]|nr:hypothetical protein BJY00DRAFT_287870 [Aspergillus carlsbadensis]